MDFSPVGIRNDCFHIIASDIGCTSCFMDYFACQQTMVESLISLWASVLVVCVLWEQQKEWLRGEDGYG